MRRALLICILAVFGACGTSEPSKPAASLAGTWNVEITRGWLPWTRKSVHGQVHLALAPLPECKGEEESFTRDGVLCPTYVAGTYSIPLDSLVRAHPYAGWTSEAWAIAMADGKILLNIGGGSDRGEIVATGRIDGDRIEGRWVQQFLNDGPGGRFVLRRAPVRAP